MLKLSYLRTNSVFLSQTHFAYSTDPTSYQVYWKGFSDPHSGLAYFRVGLGTQATMSDVIPFVYVGLQTCQLSIVIGITVLFPV